MKSNVDAIGISTRNERNPAKNILLSTANHRLYNNSNNSNRVLDLGTIRILRG